MSKKDYQLIADAIRKSSVFGMDEEDNKSIRYGFATVLADALESDNDRFDRARFLIACGTDGTL